MYIYKNDKGITILTLAVTIIVLIILAGVSINMLMGERGIVTQAQKARENIEIATRKEEEQLNILYEELINNGGGILDDSNIDAMEELKNFKKMIAEAITSEGVQTEETDTAEIMVGNIGKILQERTKDATATEADIADGKTAYANGIKIVGTAANNKVLSELITSANYGEYVDYPIDLNEDGDFSNDWRIFYNDGEHVFIIAADYVSNTSSYLNNVGTGMTVNGAYCLYWNYGNALTTQTVNISILSLFKQTWRDYSTHANGRCVSILLNTNNWDGFVNSSYAEYAIGGPTLEMWVASWNAKEYTQLYTNTNTRGYYVGNTKNPTTFAYNLSGDRGYNDTLYFPHQSEESNCKAYWLTSPGANYTNVADNLMNVDCSGSVSYSLYYSNTLGVRPLVSLKSDIIGRKDEEGVWRF